MNNDEILYICTVCSEKENIPREVVEYFEKKRFPPFLHITIISHFWVRKVSFFSHKSKKN